MIIQEDIPYTKEEVKAMTKTIHDLREQLKQCGWHPASEPPVFDEFDDNKEVIGIWEHQNLSEYFVTIPYKVADYVQYKDGKWLYEDTPVPVEYWCYPPERD